MQTVEKAFEVVGGGALFRSVGLERLLRDLHGAQFHPLQEKRQHLFTGRVALGLDPVSQGCLMILIDGLRGNRARVEAADMAAVELHQGTRRSRLSELRQETALPRSRPTGRSDSPTGYG